MRKLRRSIVAALLTFLLTPVHGAFAEPTKLDQGIAEAARKDLTSGLIFMEVKLFEEGRKTPKICQQIWVSLVSDRGNSKSVPTQSSPTLFGHAADSSTYGGSSVLPAATYTITQVWCQGSIRLKGRFARFVLRPGQVANLGCLVIDYKEAPFNLLAPRTFSGRTHVEDLSPNAVATLTRLAPVAFSKATKQYMAPNQATSNPKPSQ
jgi:hypothetical protein